METTFDSQWALDWEFSKKRSSLLVTSEKYNGVQEGESIYIKVASRIEWAICVRKKHAEYAASLL